MKEKSKGKLSPKKEMRASSLIDKQKECDSSESQEEMDFGFPMLTTVDKERHLHCYSTVMKRDPSEPVGMEELNRLQPELELMLSAAAIRFRTLQAQIDSLSNPYGAVDDIRTNSTKKRKLSDTRVTKSMKDLAKVRDRETSTKMEPSSSDNETDNSGEACQTSQPEAGSPRMSGALPTQKISELPKNDTPNRFWASIEPYTSDITEENIKEIEELIACCDADIVGVKIPPLGRHYSERWADSDLASERNSNAHNNHVNNKHTSASSDSDTVSMLKKASTMCDRTPGPLVQRLVSALIEEPSHDTFPSKLGDENDSIFMSKIPLYHTTACFERRIRRELEAVGLLDTDNEDGDEILAEIKKCEEELKAVASQNKEHLTRLLDQAKTEMRRQATKTKIKILDSEIIEMQKKTTAAKAKKKQLQKKEREHAWKLLKDREALLSTL